MVFYANFLSSVPSRDFCDMLVLQSSLKSRLFVKTLVMVVDKPMVSLMGHFLFYIKEHI